MSGSLSDIHKQLNQLEKEEMKEATILDVIDFWLGVNHLIMNINIK